MVATCYGIKGRRDPPGDGADGRMSGLRGWRSELVWTLGDPASDASNLRHFEDGLLLVDGDRIVGAGAWSELAPTLPGSVPVEHLPGRILTPGFVDGHIHFPQLDMVASPGGALLGWLERYTFPAERAFADPAHAKEAAHSAGGKSHKAPPRMLLSASPAARANSFVGTEEYLAPEIITGAGESINRARLPRCAVLCCAVLRAGCLASARRRHRCAAQPAS